MKNKKDLEKRLNDIESDIKLLKDGKLYPMYSDEEPLINDLNYKDFVKNYIEALENEKEKINKILIKHS